MATDDTNESLIALTNAREIADDLARFRDSAALFSTERPRMIDKYEKQWVAVYNGAVVAHDQDFDVVMRDIDAQTVPRQDVIVRYIERNKRTMILSTHVAC